MQFTNYELRIKTNDEGKKVFDVTDLNDNLDILFFSDRKRLEDEYIKWLNSDTQIADTPFNVITFLSGKGLLDNKKVKRFLNDVKKGD